ncbi:MAG: ABC-type Mn/Zn transport systems, ATPase component [uncultured Corynebacteriales bacterium]|uniref:ABC-type Mn/Zn transport systems, ATPase component n=1 Tax=uncultured Mycobacteriales bacterium TaxID=581187 RepID=A0A6J4J6X6_9ACTN|nr:MAG: ABC-type Mn/Zn transport systems, ATPase component [uncultured Corynebacteriales bacterium]
MADRDTLTRSLHDIGLAAWFGGSLMGAIGLNGAGAAVLDDKERARVASAGWAKWTPVNAVAIGAHLVGAAGVLRGNKGRVATQQGVGASTAAKTALTVVALGATAYARVVGKKIENAGPVPAQGPTDPSAETPPDVARAMRQEKIAQWVLPVATGGLLVLNALHGEQQRTTEVVSGTLRKLNPFGS